MYLRRRATTDSETYSQQQYCLFPRFPGGLRALHQADEDDVLWLGMKGKPQKNN